MRVTMKFNTPEIAQKLLRQHHPWKNHTVVQTPTQAEARIHFDINRVLNRYGSAKDNRVVGILLYSPESGREELIIYPRKLEKTLIVISDDGRNILCHLPVQAVPLFGTEAQRSALMMTKFRKSANDWFGNNSTVNSALRIMFGENGVQTRFTLHNTTAGMRAAIEAVRAEREYLLEQSLSRGDDLDIRMLSMSFCRSSDEHCTKMDKHQVMKAIRYKCEDLGTIMLNSNDPDSNAADKESTELAIMVYRYMALQRQEDEDLERNAHAARRETKKDT